jgi:hypothetical protein
LHVHAQLHGELRLSNPRHAAELDHFAEVHPATEHLVDFLAEGDDVPPRPHLVVPGHESEILNDRGLVG